MKSPQARRGELALPKQVRLDSICSLTFGPLMSNQVECWHLPRLGVCRFSPILHLCCKNSISPCTSSCTSVLNLSNCRFQTLFQSFRWSYFSGLDVSGPGRGVKQTLYDHVKVWCFPRHANVPLKLPGRFIIWLCLDFGCTLLYYSLYPMVLGATLSHPTSSYFLKLTTNTSKL